MILLQEVLDHARRLPGVREDFPFGFETLTLEFGDMVFLITGLRKGPVRLNIKCDSELALELRARYPDHVLPGLPHERALLEHIRTGRHPVAGAGGGADPPRALAGLPRRARR